MLSFLRIFRGLAGIALATMVAALPLSAEETGERLTIGLTTRLAPKSIAFAHELYSRFSRDAGIEVVFVEMPSQRVIRDFEEGLVDLLPFSLHHNEETTVTTRLPIISPTLVLVRTTAADPLDSADIAAGYGEYAIPRGASSIYERFGIRGKFMEVDQFQQALKLVQAGRVLGYYDWNSEIDAQIGYDTLEARGFNAVPVLRDWPFYPIMQKRSPKRYMLDRLDAWILASHEDGSLRLLFEATGYGLIYPATQLDAALAAKAG